MQDVPRRAGDLSSLDFARQAELLELTQDAILVRELGTNAITYWNRGAEALYGWSREEARGQPTHAFLHTVFAGPSEVADAELLERGFWEGKLTHTRKDGSQVVVASRQAVQRDRTGAPVAILEINTNITEREQIEAEQVRLAAEQRARQLAERSLDRLARLQQVTARLAEALTPSEVAQVVVEQCIAALGGRSGRLALLRPDGRTLDVVASKGYTWVRSPLSIDDPVPATEVIRTGEPLFSTRFEEVTSRYPWMRETIEPVIAGGSASVPLYANGSVIGVVTIVFDGDRDFEHDDRELLTAMAAQAAQALERARLYDLSLSVQEDLRRSRDQLAAILGGIAEGVTVQDARGTLVYANDVAARLSGFDSADALLHEFPAVGTRIQMFDEAGNPIRFDDLPARRLLRGESATEVLVQYRHRETGEMHWSILDAMPVRDAEGRVQMVVNIFRDITERKRQTDATELLAMAGTILVRALEVETGLRELADVAVPRMADWFIVDLLEGDGRPRRVAISYAPAEDPEVAAWLSRRVPASGGFVEQSWHSGRGLLIEDWSAASEQWRTEDDERQRLFEAMRPLSWIVTPLVARGQTFGSVTLATGRSGRRFTQADLELAQDLATRVALAIDNARLFREAHEQAEHQAMLNAALRETVDERDRALVELQQALRTRDEFLASASHDLKNPLASVKATAQLLERRLERAEPVDLARLRDGLRRIDSIVTRAAGLVEELLDLARMQMGAPLDLDRQPMDLARLAEDVAREHQTAERHSIEVSADAADLTGAWDQRRLGRVLSNLLDNAIKYSPDGGPITLRLRREDAWIVIEIEDDGIGIPEADQARIFERFQRASNVAGRIGGTGIGLASARHIVESHGGTIAVTSQEGSGAKFVVRLPVSKVQDGKREA